MDKAMLIQTKLEAPVTARVPAPVVMAAGEA